jgi:hypothetical protein
MAFSLSVVCFLNGGCVSSHVVYDKERKMVAGVWEGAFREGKGCVPCNGSIEVTRPHEFLFFPYKSYDFYGISFKTNAASPEDFYFTMAENRSIRSNTPLKIMEARGVVRLVDQRHVIIDVEYRDSGGNWRKLWLNGRHKIDEVWPDDLPSTPKLSL